MTGRGVAIGGRCAALAVAVSMVLLHAAAAQASQARTLHVVSIPSTPMQASMVGAIDPAGATTSYDVVYDVATSEWCTSDGASGTPASASAPVTLPYTDSLSHDVAVTLTGLAAGRKYCAAYEADPGTSSQSFGSVLSFAAGASLGSAAEFLYVTGATTQDYDVGPIPEVGTPVTVQVVYDLASSPWCQSFGLLGTPSYSLPAQNEPAFAFITPAGQLTGLTPGTDYCVSYLESGGANGTPSYFTAGVPPAFPPGLSEIDASSVEVTVSFDLYRQISSYQIAYGPAISQWCTSSGFSGTPAFATTPAAPPTPTDVGPASTDLTLTGLTPGEAYCVGVTDTSPSGSATGMSAYTAGLPFDEVAGAVATDPTHATVTGAVNPEDQTTTYIARYDLASSAWCTNGSGTATWATSPQTLAFNDASYHKVSVPLSGLTAGTRYCVEIVASNAAGQAAPPWPVLLAAGAPTVGNTAVASTTATDAVVSGLVNPAGQTTTYEVKYDLASSNWCENRGSPSFSTSPQTLTFTDDSPHDVSVGLTGLTAGASYCLALIATNGSGVSTSYLPSYQAAWQGSLIAGQPLATSDSSGGDGTGGEILNGTVNPAGQTTTYTFDYAVSTSPFCNPISFTPDASTPVQTLPYADGSAHTVSADITDLTPGATYCWILVATNGTAKSTTEPPPAPGLLPVQTFTAPDGSTTSSSTSTSSSSTSTSSSSSTSTSSSSSTTTRTSTTSTSTSTSSAITTSGSNSTTSSTTAEPPTTTTTTSTTGRSGVLGSTRTPPTTAQQLAKALAACNERNNKTRARVRGGRVEPLQGAGTDGRAQSMRRAQEAQEARRLRLCRPEEILNRPIQRASGMLCEAPGASRRSWRNVKTAHTPQNAEPKATGQHAPGLDDRRLRQHGPRESARGQRRRLARELPANVGVAHR